MLGATAARSLFGSVIAIGRERGRPIDPAGGGVAWIIVHPSFLLRLPDRARLKRSTPRSSKT